MVKNLDKRIKRWQIRIFAACFLAYTAAYIGRVNISVALPRIQESLNISSTGIGIIGTSFFWVYATGQLINGYMGDVFNARIFIFIGLIVSALLNLFMGFSNTLISMTIIWGLNGVFQSMLWGPIVKTLSNWYPEKLNPKVAFGMSFTMVLGYLLAWGFSGVILNSFGWRWVFWLPAVLVAFLAFVWFFMIRNSPQDAGLPDVHVYDRLKDERELKSIDDLEDKEEEEIESISFLRLIGRSNLILIAITGFSQGMIKDSIAFWGPKLIADTQNLSMESTLLAVLLIPILNFIGMLFAGWLNKMLKFREKISVILLMTGGGLAALSLVFLKNSYPYLSILMVALVSAFMLGCNPAMTTLIPLSYKRYGRVSSVAGFIDFSIYVGSGIAGALTGFMVDRSGWNSVFIMWSTAALLGATSMILSIVKERRSPMEI